MRGQLRRAFVAAIVAAVAGATQAQETSDGFVELVEAAYELHVSDPMQAIKLGEQALSIVHNAPQDPELMRKLYASLAWAYVEDGRYSDALALAERTRQMALENNEPENLVRALRAIAQVHYDAGDSAAALSTFLSAKQQSENIGDFQLGGILIGLGQVHEAMGDYERALENYHQASRYFERNDTNLGRAVAFSNVSTIHGKLGRYDDALAYAEQARDLVAALGDRRRVALIHLSIGKWHRLAGRPQEALDVHTAYLAEMQALSLRLDSARFLTEMGEDYLALENLNSAARSFTQAMEIWQAEAQPYEEANTQIKLAAIDRKLGRVPEARVRLEQAMTTIWLIETDFQRERLEEDALFEFAATNEALGNSDEALAAFHRHRSMLTDRLQRERETSLADAAARFNVDLKQKEIELLQQRQAYQQLELQRQQQVRIGLVVLFVMAILVVGLLYNRERLRARAAAENERAERERAARLDELKVLSGLLPICSVCKNIRDEAGYWSQLEAYIDKNSEASFTHSICESCMEEELADIDER